jgi:hypothetical protein
MVGRLNSESKIDIYELTLVILATPWLLQKIRSSPQRSKTNRLASWCIWRYSFESGVCSFQNLSLVLDFQLFTLFVKWIPQMAFWHRSHSNKCFFLAFLLLLFRINLCFALGKRFEVSNSHATCGHWKSTNFTSEVYGAQWIISFFIEVLEDDEDPSYEPEAGEEGGAPVEQKYHERSFVTFPDEMAFLEAFPGESSRASPRRGQLGIRRILCPITAKPARYRDPVTKVRHSPKRLLPLKEESVRGWKSCPWTMVMKIKIC